MIDERILANFKILRCAPNLYFLFRCLIGVLTNKINFTLASNSERRSLSDTNGKQRWVLRFTITESGQGMNMGTAEAQSHPRVSVVMAINRVESYLAAAVASILNQSFQDFELLIIADTSSDELRDGLIQEYSEDNRIRILESPPLGGLSLALNLGIGQARGEYIARMDGDDISLPSRLEEQVYYLDRHPRVAVLGCRLRLIGPDSEPLSQQYPYYGSNTEIRRILPIRNPMPHPGLMMRKSALFAVGGYKYGHSSEDYELFLRMSRNPEIEFHNLDSVLLEYRRHESQGTNIGYFKRRFTEMAGYLFTEFLRSGSPKYIVGMVVIHPWTRRIRSLFRVK